MDDARHRSLRGQREDLAGLDADGLRRKVFRVVDEELVDAEHIAAG